MAIGGRGMTEYCRPNCARFVVHKTANARGWIFSLRCPCCQRLGERRSWIPKKQVDRSRESDMPVYGELPKDVCIVCGTICKTERNHFAPRNRFVDADNWPQGDLCAACHDRWHRVMG